MQFGMRAHDLGKKDFLSLIKEINEMGINKTQLAFYKAIDDIDFTLGNFNEGLCEYMSRELKKHDITVSVFGSYINPIHEDVEVRNKEIAKFKENLKYTKYLDAKMAATETGKLLDWSDAGIEKQYQIFLDTMKQVRNDAEKLGVFFAVEGVSTETMHDSKLIKRFFEEIDSPNALSLYDPANLIMVDETSNAEIGKNIDACFEDFGDRIAILHLKDFVVKTDENGNKTKQAVPIGEGVMDFERLFFHTKRRKPHITALIEDTRKDRYHREIEYLNKIYANI